MSKKFNTDDLRNGSRVWDDEFQLFAVVLDVSFNEGVLVRYERNEQDEFPSWRESGPSQEHRLDWDAFCFKCYMVTSVKEFEHRYSGDW